MQNRSPPSIADEAQRWLGKAMESLDEGERRVLEKAVARHPIAHNPNETFASSQSFGDRLADRVASFGGSWTFIICFVVFLAVWAGVNIALARRAFDPYPFIFLNLMLSMVAALQAPIIMMSQNRQAAKDRADAAHDYEVNLKAELEIMALHEKLDRLRTEEIEALIRQQQAQLDLLTKLAEVKRSA